MEELGFPTGNSQSRKESPLTSARKMISKKAQKFYQARGPTLGHNRRYSDNSEIAYRNDNAMIVFDNNFTLCSISDQEDAEVQLRLKPGRPLRELRAASSTGIAREGDLLSPQVSANNYRFPRLFNNEHPPPQHHHYHQF